MTKAPVILYVEDDPTLGFVTMDNLQERGYTVIHCADGESARAQIQQGGFDLCILDVMLPKVDGFQLARELRERDTEAPILFLTARSLQSDRLLGLRLGGDDYLVKPFSLEELFLKIEVFLRRSGVRARKARLETRIGHFTFFPHHYQLSFEGKIIELTQKEAALLDLFIQHRGEVLRRSFILESIWGEDDYFLGRSLDVFVSRLRKHLRSDPSIRIENVHGVGFRLFDPATDLQVRE